MPINSNWTIARRSRFYPVTEDNLPECPGKHVFAESTGRIRGTVYFTDASGNPAQPMQGVNVVARRVDSDTHQPLGPYAASAVSGFLFSGNAGNPITGFSDAFGQQYDRFGSNDSTLEGFFDLAGVGSSTTMTAALTLGAGPNDVIHLAQGSNSPTPVGMAAATPIRVVVASSDGITPVPGATVQWSVTNGVGLSACNGAATCYAYTDDSGQAETRVIVGAVGTANISATLAPASYAPPKMVQSAVSGTSSAKDLALLVPKVWVVQGATVDVPFSASGSQQSGSTEEAD